MEYTKESLDRLMSHGNPLFLKFLLYLQIRKIKCHAVFANTVCTAFVSCLQTVVDCLGTMNLV